MDWDWKALFEVEDREIERVLDEINKDPRFKDVVAPPEIHDKLFAQIREYEEKKKLELFSEEEIELLRLGKVYRKSRKVERFAILVAAVVAMLAIGTVSMGEGNKILTYLKRVVSGEEHTISDAGSTEPIEYVEEEKVYEKIQSQYGFTPVRLEYLPQNIKFQEAVFYAETQATYLYYGGQNDTEITYRIRPNYRNASAATVIEDEKLQEYKMTVHDTEVSITEYRIQDTDVNRWSIIWTYQEVQYMLNLTDMTQTETEKIVETLRFVK